RVDELLLGFRVDPVRHGFRLLPVEADAVHQLDQPGTAIVEPEPLQDELPDLGGRRLIKTQSPGAQFVDLEGRQPSCSALQVEQDERLDAAFLEFLDPDADGRIVDEQRLGNRGEGPASVEQQNGVRPAGAAILLQPVPGNRHKVGPIRCTEEIAVRLHQASGIDPADSVKRFPKERGIPLYLAFNFQLSVTAGFANRAIGGFSEMSGLSTENTAAEYRPGGAQGNFAHKYPGVYKATDVTLKRGVVS